MSALAAAPAGCARVPGVTVVGRVAFWRQEEGWGVVACEQTPGGCWVHYSAVQTEGFRELHPRQEVDLDWEHTPQDGYRFRATSVWPHGQNPRPHPGADSTASAAYRSTVVIDRDEHPRA